MRLALLIGLFLTIQTAYAAEQPTFARVTTYWREEGEFRAAWNGARLRNGHCAVDPKKIPYGSRIQLGDEELIAVDTGPAVVSRKAARRLGRNATERNAVVVDRYFETKSQAVAWEKSHSHFMKVRGLSPGAIVSKKSGADHTDLPPKTRIATLFQSATFIWTLSSDYPVELLATPVDAPVASWSSETLSQGVAAAHSIGSAC